MSDFPLRDADRDRPKCGAVSAETGWFRPGPGGLPTGAVPVEMRWCSRPPGHDGEHDYTLIADPRLPTD